jgi:hypothetical protein
MSAGLCEIVSCATVQQNLDNTFAASNMRPEKLPFLSYVMSPENRAASNFEITGPSKVKTLQIIYDQPMLTSDVSQNGSGCTASTEECDTYQTYTFDSTANDYVEFTVSPTDLVGTCEENSAFIARKIQKRLNVLKEKISENLADTAVSDRGAWSVDTANIDGTNVTATDILQVNTRLVDGTPNVINSALFEQVSTALDMSRIENAGIFGKNDLASFLRRSFAGADDSIGYNLKAMMERYGIAMMYDRHLASSIDAIGATNLAVGIGSIVPVGFSLYEAQANKVNNGTDIAETIYDPETGMKFDLRVHRVCDAWNFNIRATYQFYTWPDDLYKSGSNWEGVKGLAAIEATCTDLQPCS